MKKLELKVGNILVIKQKDNKYNQLEIQLTEAGDFWIRVKK